jgi:formate/nitrite transporter FocA (FNT family)
VLLPLTTLGVLAGVFIGLGALFFLAVLAGTDPGFGPARLAVWLTFAAREVAGRILAIIFPVTAFVALGLEHSVANMFLLPFAMSAGGPGDIAAIAHNPLRVSLGNIVGGGDGVALTYWAAYRIGSAD